MSESKMGRREAARRALMVLGAAAIAPSALVGCGEEGGAGLSCNDTSGLQPAQIATRTSTGYLDASPHADKNCTNCRFYTAGADAHCGTCQVVPGPINPAGYSNLWAAQA